MSSSMRYLLVILVMGAFVGIYAQESKKTVNVPAAAQDKADEKVEAKAETKSDPADYCVRWGKSKSGILLPNVITLFEKDDRKAEGYLLLLSRNVRPSLAAELISPADVDFEAFIRLDYALEPFLPEMRRMDWESRVILIGRFLVITEAAKKGCLMKGEPHEKLNELFAAAHPKSIKALSSDTISKAYGKEKLKEAQAAFDETWDSRKGTLLSKSKFEPSKDGPDGWVKILE